MPSLFARRAGVLRTAAVMGACVLLGLVWHLRYPYGAENIVVMALGTALSAVLVPIRRTWAQLVVRSVLLANLLIGVENQLQLGPVLIPLASGGALLSLGRRGLEPEAGSAFRPVAFRGVLALAVIVALADAMALAEIGSTSFGGSEHRLSGVLHTACAAVFALAALGIYRLRMWGILCSLFGALAAFGFALTNAFRYVPGWWVGAGGIMLMALVHVVLTLPLFFAVAAARGPPRARVFGSVLAEILENVVAKAAVWALLVFATMLELAPGPVVRLLAFLGTALYG